ncbi:MAG: sugar transferase [Patescibacteria group bacterium]|jgi:exopolysaccharide biosynthesis polyprenyl glycosylphosphotransferase
MKKKTDLIFSLLLVPLDALMVICGFIIAYYFRTNLEIVPVKGSVWDLPHYINFALYLLPIWLVIFALEGLYSGKRIKSGIKELTSIFMGVSTGTTVVVIWIFFSKTEFFSRLIVLYIWLASLVTLILGRALIKIIQRFLYQYNIGTKKIIIAGWDKHVAYLAGRIQDNKGYGFQIIGYLNDNKLENDFKYLGSIEDFEKVIKEKNIDEIFIFDKNITDDRMSEILAISNMNNVVFKVIPNSLEMKASNIDVYAMEGVPILQYRRTPLAGWGRIFKRFIDLLGSALGLIILSPFFLVIAIIIKLDSKGPVFFKQERVGQNGNFMFYKFRSMKLGAEKEHEEYIKKYGNMFKLKDDPRTTKFGRFLRKTSLDELAQLINVFKGEMSLVGPRPPMVEEVKLYNPWQKQRLGIKPGLTGLWQVSGRSDINFDEWVKLDIYYIENWSLWLDIKIILKTIEVVFLGKGAY